MLTLYKNDKSKVMKQIQNGVLDSIVASNTNLVDDIILSMYHEGILECLNNGFPDKRNKNSFIPFNTIMSLAIAAKMKVMTSLTDIPYAITDHRLLSKLGFNISTGSGGSFTEGTIRHLIGKYSDKDFFNYYNNVVQNNIFTDKDICTDIHILDCTKIAVNYDNPNYENSSIAIDRKGERMRGYKLATIRGLYGDTGIIEDIRFGTASMHDYELSKDMLLNSSCIHDSDVLLMDRGFFSREILYYLKNKRKVDVYIPLRKNLSEYNMAVAIAEETDDWKPHPTRKDQMICHVSYVDATYDGNEIDYIIPLNTAVVWFQETQSYVVFATTDMTKSAEDIIKLYELRTEIEEDFRQLKDFWKLEDFHSTKLNVISFHIVCVLFGYLFYQLYLNTDDGQKYIGKCLPVILKKYKSDFTGYLTLYSGNSFCTLSMKEFLVFYENNNNEIRGMILKCFN